MAERNVAFRWPFTAVHTDSECVDSEPVDSEAADRGSLPPDEDVH